MKATERLFSIFDSFRENVYSLMLHINCRGNVVWYIETFTESFLIVYILYKDFFF